MIRDQRSRAARYRTGGHVADISRSNIAGARVLTHTVGHPLPSEVVPGADVTDDAARRSGANLAAGVDESLIVQGVLAAGHRRRLTVRFASELQIPSIGLRGLNRMIVARSLP